MSVVEKRAVRELSISEWNEGDGMQKLKTDTLYGQRFRVVRELGEGTTGQVYLVRCQEQRRLFAMKVCRDKELLQAESVLLKSLKQGIFPHWQGYFEEEIGKNPQKMGFLVMEYIEGVTLQEFLRKKGKCSSFEAGDIVIKLLEGLKVLHEQSPPIIYRDIKPANIMLDVNGNVRLVDAGSAVQGKYKVGTYGYAAPEQFWEGVQPTPECDFYGVGKVFAFLLTGKDPGQPPYDMINYCSRDRNVEEDFFRIIQRSLAIDSMGRYHCAEEFIRDLRACLRRTQRKKWNFCDKKQKIVYEKCVWKSEYQRIF